MPFHFYPCCCRHIIWPKEGDFPRCAQEFYRIRGFPKVIGAIDGTHVALRNPSKDNNLFYNRKNFTSVNVLVSRLNVPLIWLPMD